MAFLQFQKEHLSDLGLSLNREYLLVNQNGTYCSSSIINCNTRKYHGLFVTHQPQIDDNKYVLLSCLDETLVRGDKKIPLSTHRYPHVYNPEGYKLLNEFSYEKNPQWTILAGDIELSKDILLVHNEDRLLICYTVKQCDTPFELKLDPFFVYRNIHGLGRANLNVAKKTERITNGIKLRMYSGFDNMFLQLSRKADFIPAPDWYYNVEYPIEQDRGYDYKEDMYTPGYFKIKLRKNDQLILSAGTSEISPRRLLASFEREQKHRKPLDNFKECLENAAEQFIINKAKPEIVAGYHWFGPWGRDTFISLPGLTLATGKPEVCKAVMNTYLKQLKNGLLPNVGKGENAAYNTADASLWFFWTLQQYTYNTGTIKLTWDEYGNKMKSILDNYRKGTLHNIHMEYNGLLYAGEPGVAVTWMDAVVNGKPVTPRTGFAVELNALWYNAIHFAIECAEHAGDRKFLTSDWSTLLMQIELAFNETFWNEEKGYLADCVNGSQHDWSLRPNQIIAAALPYSPIKDNIRKSVLDIVKNKLLTPRGLRTLAPEDPNYKKTYHGNLHLRDNAYHQGTVWPWLLGPFTEAYLKVYGEQGTELLQSIYENFAPAVLEYGIGTIAEIYDGDEPHRSKGAISQAWSVAELLRMRSLLMNYSHKKEEVAQTIQVETV